MSLCICKYIYIYIYLSYIWPPKGGSEKYLQNTYVKDLSKDLSRPCQYLKKTDDGTTWES